jgi:hypothetical protein
MSIDIKFTPKNIDVSLWDNYFSSAYAMKTPVTFTFDLTQLDTAPNIKNLIELKSVLDKHREDTKKYLQSSKIILKNKTLKNTLSLALPLIKPEKPVTIV